MNLRLNPLLTPQQEPLWGPVESALREIVRFWKTQNDADKQRAFETLWEVLTVFSQMLAPIMPWHAFANLTKQDADGIVAFLRSLPPVFVGQVGDHHPVRRHLIEAVKAAGIEQN